MLTRWLPRRMVTLPRPRLPQLAPLALLFLCGSLFLQGIGSRDLWASHEARAAQNAQRMLDDGHWLLPRLYDGQVETQKPPGFYWLVAAVGWARGGVDAVAVRLPAVVAGMLTVLMVWWHLRKRGRPVAGFVAAAMLAAAVHYTGTARIGRIDVPLACVVAAILIVSRDALAERVTQASRGLSPSASGHPRYALRFASRLTAIALVGALAGIALLLKGPIGVVLPAATLGVYLVVERVPIRLWLVPVVLSGAIALAVALPWYIWAHHATAGEFTRNFLLYHHLNRAFGGAEALASHPWWFYFPRFAADFLPWTPLLLVALAQRRWRGDADARFGLVWFTIVVLVLACSRFKRADYLLPAYAGAAIFLGCAAERWYQAQSPRTHRRAACGFGLTLALLPVGWLAFDHLVTSKEEAARAQSPFAHTIREVAPAPTPVHLFRVESHLLVYHLGRPVHTLVEWTDLDARLRPPGPHFVVTRAEFLDEIRQHVGAPVEVVARSEDANRARAHRPLILLRIGTPACPINPRD